MTERVETGAGRQQWSPRVNQRWVVRQEEKLEKLAENGCVEGSGARKRGEEGNDLELSMQKRSEGRLRKGEKAKVRDE